MSIKSFYIAFYMLEFSNLQNNLEIDSIIKQLLKLFGNTEILIKSNFIETLGLFDFFIFQWENTLFFFFVGNQSLRKSWSAIILLYLRKFLENYFSDSITKHFCFTDLTYLRKEKSRRLGSIGGAFRRMFLIIRKKTEFKVNKKHKNTLNDFDNTEVYNDFDNTEVYSDLTLCILFNDNEQKRQELDDILVSVAGNKKIPKIDLKYYALIHKKQNILSKVDQLIDENDFTHNQSIKNKDLKEEIKVLVEAL